MQKYFYDYDTKSRIEKAFGDSGSKKGIAKYVFLNC